MKIDLEQVEATLLERKVEPLKVADIIKDLTQAAEEDKEDRKANAGPKAKWEHVVVINDPEGKVTGEVTAWVMQQQDGQDAGLILSKLADATKTQNESAKRKKNILSSYIDIFNGLKSKFLKEKGLRIKTKEPVRVLIVK
jgi:hypothetical protein